MPSAAVQFQYEAENFWLCSCPAFIRRQLFGSSVRLSKREWTPGKAYVFSTSRSMRHSRKRSTQSMKLLQ